MPYTISWRSESVLCPAHSEGGRQFDNDTPFHSALSELCAQEGPVDFWNLATEMRLAGAAGAYVDPMAIIGVLTTAIGIFGGNGDAEKPTESARAGRAAPSLN